MLEDLTIVLEGKNTVINNQPYLSASDYIQPFVDRMRSTFHVTDFKCYVKMPTQLSITNGMPDIVYNRVHIQAILPESYYQHGDYQKVIGFVYGLDTKTPLAKFYVGDINMQNGNVVVFNNMAQITQRIEPNTALDYTCIESLLSLTDNNTTMMDQLKSVIVDRDQLPILLGNWLDTSIDIAYCNESGKIKLPNSLPLEAYKELLKNKDSYFYVAPEKVITLYHIYQVFLSQITNDEKDILNRFEKTILINRVLKIQ